MICKEKRCSGLGNHMSEEAAVVKVHFIPKCQGPETPRHIDSRWPASEINSDEANIFQHLIPEGLKYHSCMILPYKSTQNVIIGGQNRGMSIEFP